ncbi:quorum-quenching N-acyl homoserine lactonase AiiA [Priestia taiwanensis]|uniref:quorum-quenching N-acyl-homoserine lactonase n=1 Tax=Priestia taiwanensis TaxID=1347902 RepID=A0A917ANI6_9BACI|nr:N-acyl homoserine lactonase family protein [Priestia taiwanensis]MBM7362405.1 N-acyl homoserine lactone hydrolase [Priestia taiwanensis]GGE61996.1 N-acyl homoserine lactonase [Priestia taiwanensis]
MTVKKLYCLQVGTISNEQSLINSSLPPGKFIDIPIWAYIIVTDKNIMLIDTGMPKIALGNRDVFKGTHVEGLILPNMVDKDLISNALQQIGYTVEDITCVISTHLHFDHAGGNELFKDIPIYVQKVEYEAALEDYNYLRECVPTDLNYHFIEGDYTVETGVELLFTPGHSAGHQSVLLTTEKSGKILLTIDVAYTKDTLDKELPAAYYNTDMALASIKRLKDIIDKENPLVFYGHDIEQGKEIKSYPAYY